MDDGLQVVEEVGGLALQRTWLGSYTPPAPTVQPMMDLQDMQDLPATVRSKPADSSLLVRDGKPLDPSLTERVRQLLASDPCKAFMLCEIVLALPGRAERYEVTPILAKLRDRGQVKRGQRFNGRRLLNTWKWAMPVEQPMAA